MISALMEAALRALLLALAVWTGLRAFRIANVLAQKAAWGLVLFSALAMPLVQPLAARWQWMPPAATLVLPAHPLSLLAALWPQPQLVGAPQAKAPAAAEPGVLPGTGASADAAPARSFVAKPVSGGAARLPALPASPSNPAAPAAPPHPAAGMALRLATLAWILYFAVAAGLLLRLLFGLFAALRLWQQAVPISVAGSADLAAGLDLRSSHAISSPVTIGSAVVLPAGYTLWNAEKLRIVLAHERSHVRQGDFYLQILAGLHAIVFWFSPLGWWLKRKLSDLGETIGDRAGLREAENGSSYARILLEFAAAPRLTVEGVAMARRSNLSERIERLLDDSTFHQAFAGGRRRVLFAVLLVPAALFAATALVRVEAAGQAQQPAPAAAQSQPEPAADARQAKEQAEEKASAAERAEAAEQSRDAVDESNSQTATNTSTETNTQTSTNVTVNGRVVKDRSFSYNSSSDGDSYALVTGPGDRFNFSGNWNGSADEQIEKARKLAHGNFLWFRHDGKSYFVEDPAILARIEAMVKPMEALGRQQEELGRQQEQLGKQQRELGREMEKLRVPPPEAAKEIAELKAKMATLAAQMKKTTSPEELGEMGGKMGELGGRLGELAGEMGARQGELGGKMGALGEQQGKLGERQGKLGEEQGRLGEEANRKVKAIMDQSLRDGKARPVD